MTKLEELKLQLEAAHTKAVEAYQPVAAMQDKLKAKWTNLLNTILPAFHNRIRIWIDYEASITVDILDDNDKVIFGTECEMRVNQKHVPWTEREAEDYKPTYELRIGCGTCGNFTKDEIGQIQKYANMGCLCENFELLETTFTEDIVEYRKVYAVYLKASNEEERVERQISEEEDRIKKEEFLKTVDYEAVYRVSKDYRYLSRERLEGFDYFKFEKDTDKYEYLLVGYADRQYDYETGEYKEVGNFRACKSKRFDKGTFVRWLMQNVAKKVEKEV